MSFIAVFGSGIRDPGGVKSGSGINIPDPQHCVKLRCCGSVTF